MSGEIEITPGYQFPDGLTKQTHARLNQLGNPTARLAAGSVTERELGDNIEFGDKLALASIWEDFLNANDSIGTSSSGVVGSAKLTATAGTSGSIGSVARPTSDPCAGVLRLRTLGSGANPFCFVRSASVPQCYPGSGTIRVHARIMLQNANATTSALRLYFGLGDPANSNNAPTDGLWFFVENGGVWRMKSAASSVVTDQGHNDGPDLNEWIRLEIELSAAGDEAKFYLDGELIGTITTNLPASTTGLCLFLINYSDTGEGNNDVLVDFLSLSVAFDHSR